MWLIDTTTLELEFFTAPNVPQYAILSHTWGHVRGDKEVSFQDFKDLKKAKTMSGFSKIAKTCQLARESGIEYAWIDTCCIDKSSSAELSESINSMYSWYRQSKICYAYISDWPPHSEWADLSPVDKDSTDHKRPAVILENSDRAECFDSRAKFAKRPGGASFSSGSNTSIPLRWFTRGWTLQELIAPTVIEFYDQVWNFKGSKSDSVVAENLSRITGITTYILEDGSFGRLRGTSLGQRMSWAAYRETSRTEDTAYCLLGIFQVNMPMLYGEGDRAFLRLQEEIIKSTTDLSLFAWTQHDQDGQQYRGIFSCHPREFAGLRDCLLLKSHFSQAEEVAITNKGLRIHTSLFHPFYNGTLWDGTGTSVMYLGCVTSGRLRGIFLKRGENDAYVRLEPNCLTEISDFLRRDEARTIYITRDWDHYESHEYAAALANGVKVQLTDAEPYIFDCIGAWPSGLYDQISNTILVRDRAQFLCFLKLAVVDKSFLPGMPRRVIDFIAVCYDIDGNTSVRLLEGDQAEKFTNHTQLVWNMDPITAQNDLYAYCLSLTENCGPDIIFESSSAGVLLRVFAKTDVCERPSTVNQYSDIQKSVINITLEII